MARVLMLYSSVYGHSRRICERIQSEIAAQGHEAEIAPLGEGPDPGVYDGILIAASIRHGKHNPAVLDYIQKNLALLESKPSAFFSVSLVARKPHKNTPETNPYVKAFIARSPWKPRLVGVFGGELDYQRYGPFDRHVIRFIMKINKGPTDLGTKHVFTNWDEVSRFAGRLSALVSGGSPVTA